MCEKNTWNEKTQLLVWAGLGLAALAWGNSLSALNSDSAVKREVPCSAHRGHCEAKQRHCGGQGVKGESAAMKGTGGLRPLPLAYSGRCFPQAGAQGS